MKYKVREAWRAKKSAPNIISRFSSLLRYSFFFSFKFSVNREFLGVPLVVA